MRNKNMRFAGLTPIVAFTIAFWAPLISAAEKQPPIQLVLVISVDQMPYDYLNRFGPLFQHGFKTLLQNGAVFSEARYRHANTETGPGHAVILSGRHASHSGIIANGWYDSYLKRWVNVVEDPLYQPVGAKGRPASPANFVGFTLGDALKGKSPETKVVGVSGKDRSAVLMAGKLGDGAFWFEKSEGKFATSTYYLKQAPDWLTHWNETHRPSGDKGEVASYDNFLLTPFLDDISLDFALEARRVYRLGEDPVPDILAISFSATDYIGHNYGPDSEQMREQMLSLDRVLGRLFSEVDAKVGLNRTLVVLTSDHGVLPLVENLQSMKIPAKRVKPAELQARLDAALQKRFPGKKGLIAYSNIPFFWLDKDKINAFGLKISDVENVMMKALKASGVIESVYRSSDFLKDAPAKDSKFALYQNSFFAPRSPDIIATVRPYVYIDYYGGGTGHGTPHEYDRHVPIIFMGSGIRAGLFQEPCGPEDIAPTLASIFGIEFPKEEDSRLLSEMLD